MTPLTPLEHVSTGAAFEYQAEEVVFSFWNPKFKREFKASCSHSED